MKFNDIKKDTHLQLLAFIVLIAAALRIHGLAFQSLWLDELYTMKEADPGISLSQMLYYLRRWDQTPPLFFMIERVLFSVFGYTAAVARGFSVFCGVASVVAMYFLGKEILSKNLGIAAAMLTCFNYFNIVYSQEARSYIMAFLFTALSFMFFIRLIKQPDVRNALLYSLLTLLMLYSHYYAMFVVVSQAVVCVIFFCGEPERRKQNLKAFLLSGILILIGYLPMVPFVLGFAEMKSFWISPISQDFAIRYFGDYFNNSALLRPFLVLLLTFYCWRVFSAEHFSFDQIRQSPILLSFMVFFLCAVITYFIPYMRSLITIPMLFNRYTIVVLPGFLIAMGYGLTLINNRFIQILIGSTIALLSVTDLFFVSKFYTTIRKTQFRELTEYIKSNSQDDHPIVNELTPWQMSYYLDLVNYKGTQLQGIQETTVDSILRGTIYIGEIEAFWLVGAHGQSRLKPEVQQNLDSAFGIIKQVNMWDAWAQLYIRKAGKETVREIVWPGLTSVNNEMVIPIWSGSVSSKPINVKPGKYKISIFQRGTTALGEFAHLNVYVNDRLIGGFDTTEKFSEINLYLEIAREERIVLKLDLSNDFFDNVTGSDRNVFIQLARLIRQQ